MTAGTVFLSYSREQLYFAEALSVKLQKVGVDVWLDLQRLEPGGNWMEQIRAALHECSTLVLVASRKALASPYVQLEWQTALKDGKCVYIALYEEVNLPSGLKSASLVDFRGSFPRGLRVLAQALRQGKEVHEQAPAPGWMNLPRRLPPGIQLVARMLILDALATPFVFAFIRFPMITPLVWFINGLFGAGTMLWLWWKLLHHRHVHAAGLFGLLVPYFYFAFYLFSSFFESGMSDDLFPGKWIGLIVLGWVLIALVYVIFGAEFLRWSKPGEGTEMQMVRRWFNRARGGKRKAGSAPALDYALSARGGRGAAVTTFDGGLPRTDRVASKAREPVNTYTLSYASADRPVAASLRRAFGKPSLAEVESDSDVHIVILSQYLPRSTLEKLLDSQVRVIALLVENLILSGDELLERVTRLQLIDFRQRSAKLLPAFAKTLKDAAETNLHVSVETTPRSLHETTLPPGTDQVGRWVLAIGVYLLLAALSTVILGSMGLIPLAPLDLPGLLLGPVLIRQGSAFPRRRTTGWAFFPAFGLSAWLSISIFFLAFFLFSFELPSNPALWLLTPGKLLILNESFPLLCFLPFTFFLVPFILFSNIAQYKVWLPASTRRAKGQACLQPLPDRKAGRWLLQGWLAGAFLVFGLGPAMYVVYYFILNVMTNF